MLDTAEYQKQPDTFEILHTNLSHGTATLLAISYQTNPNINKFSFTLRQMITQLQVYIQQKSFSDEFKKVKDFINILKSKLLDMGRYIANINSGDSRRYDFNWLRQKVSELKDLLMSPLQIAQA